MSPIPGALYWDGKLMECLYDKYSSNERLSVLMSGIGGMKLFGVPVLPVKSTESAGHMVSNVKVNIIVESDTVYETHEEANHLFPSEDYSNFWN